MSAAKGGDQPRDSARGGNPPASQHAPHGGPSSSDGLIQGTAGRAGGTRRRRWQHRSKPTGGIIMGAPADYEDSAAAARCFPKPDPLALELCACAGPPAWVDPTLEELTASLVVTPLTGAPVAAS
jgi:hypothetical protein